VASLLTDDFTFSGATPQPLGKQAFITGQRAWTAGVPDWRVTLENLREDGEVVRSSSRITGTRTGMPALPGQVPLPATGKQFSALNETTATVRGNQIAAVHLVPSGRGILEQLGV
jgi:SnoaL-like domain